MGGETFTFDDYELDSAGFEVRRRGSVVKIEPRVFDVLHHLVINRRRVVSKEELLDAVWGSRFVSEASLTTALRAARRAIGDSGTAQRLIRTAHGRGYQFVGEVCVYGHPPGEPPGSAPGADANAHERQSIRFCRAADGTRIAYARVGTGPPLLKAANWISHIDLEWATPVWSHWLKGLARHRELVRYDERGCGMSDWAVPSSTFEDWVSDLEAVVDAVGLETFPLLGVSQGGAVAVEYAARHPERVSRLVLAGAYAEGRQVRARTDLERAEAAIDLDLARVGWAREDATFLQVFASQFLPDGTTKDWDEFTGFLRRTTSPENAIGFLEEFALLDVTATASRVTCPTLILHSRGDRRVPIDQATELATLIPDSALVLLESDNHLLTAGEPAWPEFLAHIDRFLAA